MSTPAPPRQRPRRDLVRQLGPWVVAALALLWVSRSVKWSLVLQSFERVPVAQLLGTSLLLLIANCAADTLAMYYTFGWFGCRLRYRELYVIRAATYLLAVVQYYVGQAAVIGFLRQRRGVPLWRGAGWVLFISGINMGVLVLLSTVGLFEARLPFAWLRLVPIGLVCAGLAYALILRLRPERLASHPLLAPLFEMGIAGHLKATLVRIPHIAVLIVWHFLALRWFGVSVPPIIALAYLPVVFFFAALPVSVQGLGLSQWAAVTFFAAYAPQGASEVLAYSLGMTGISVLLQVLMGLVFLRPAQKLGLRERELVLETAGTGQLAES